MSVIGCVSKCDSLVYLVRHSFLIIFQLSTLQCNVVEPL